MPPDAAPSRLVGLRAFVEGNGIAYEVGRSLEHRIRPLGPVTIPAVMAAWKSVTPRGKFEDFDVRRYVEQNVRAYSPLKVRHGAMFWEVLDRAERQGAVEVIRHRVEGHATLRLADAVVGATALRDGLVTVHPISPRPLKGAFDVERLSTLAGNPVLGPGATDGMPLTFGNGASWDALRALVSDVLETSPGIPPGVEGIELLSGKADLAMPEAPVRATYDVVLADDCLRATRLGTRDHALILQALDWAAPVGWAVELCGTPNAAYPLRLLSVSVDAVATTVWMPEAPASASLRVGEAILGRRRRERARARLVTWLEASGADEAATDLARRAPMGRERT